MTYINATMRRNEKGFAVGDDVLVWECINKKNILKTYKGIFEFYARNEIGEHESVFGETLQKYEFDTFDEFRQARKYLTKERNIELYESDISPESKILSKYYYEAETPEVNVLLYDIEVDYKSASYDDSYVARTRKINSTVEFEAVLGDIRSLPYKDQLKLEVYDPKNRKWYIYPFSNLTYEGPIGFSSPLNPYAPINAISMYKQWEDRSIVLAVPPPGWDHNSFDKSLADLTEIRFFDNERDLLIEYLKEIEDASIISGWNCVSENESVYLNDRIIPIKNVVAGNQTLSHGIVKAQKSTGIKTAYQLKTTNGMTIDTSKDHIFPACVKDPDKYNCYSTLIKSKQDLRVHEIIDLLNDGQQVFVSIPRHENTNKDLTYHDLIVDHYEQLFRSGVKIYIKNTDHIDMIHGMISDETKNQLLEENKHAKRKNYAILLNLVKDELSSDLIRSLLCGDVIYYSHESYGKTIMRELNQYDVISNDIIQLIGFIYTDGFYSNYDRRYSMCNKYFEVMDRYLKICYSEGQMKFPMKELVKCKDNCYYAMFAQPYTLSFLHMMIYDGKHKKLDLTLLSRLSFKQFMGFISGFIDGDGWVTPETGCINLCNYNNDMDTVHKLLAWNKVFVSSSCKTALSIPKYDCSSHFFDALTIVHPKRKLRIDQNPYTSVTNSSSKRLRKIIHDDNIWIQIKSIEEQNDVLMYDIMTEKDYFICNGILVHNSSGFDDPYTARRIELVLGPHYFDKLSFEGGNRPAYAEIFVKGVKQLKILYSGRVQLDYLELFKKFEGGERASYKLETVAEDHLPHLKKLTYPGTLEQLYFNDFNHFLRYNVRDTEILKGFETKLAYIKVANEMIHSSTNQFNHIFGTVRMVDSAIINYCHYVLNKIVPDRRNPPDGTIQGAYVLLPQKGIHKWICSIDINSLYPSAIRSLNISPETVIGQFVNNIADWTKIFERVEDDLTMKYDDGHYETRTTSEWIQYFEEQVWAVSGYGTVFTQKFQGIIPSLLALWYSQRKKYQAEMKKYIKEAEAIKYDFSSGQPVERKEYDTVLYNEITEKVKYFNRLQYIFKIKLNSTYGCLSNYNFRFFRLELGESTTGTSRQILKHQCRQTNYILSGEYNIDFPLYESMKVIDNINKEHSKRMQAQAEENGEVFEFSAAVDISHSEKASLAQLIEWEKREYYHPGTLTHDMALDGPKFNGEFPSKKVVYGDTDSTYFTVDATTAEEAIAIADSVAEQVNASYDDFVRKAFLCKPGFDNHVKCGREVVSDNGLFVEKKRYVLHVIDNEGETVDKMKIMGLDIKKTTLPKPIAAKITTFVKRLLQGEDWDGIAYDVVAYKDELMQFDNLLEVGLPKGVNKVEDYTIRYQMEGLKANLPGNAAAAIHFNERLKEYKDIDTGEISSGTKIKIYYLKNKMGKFTSIALPSDLEEPPEWFTENFVSLIDKEKQLSRLVDNPLKNILKAIDVPVPTAQTVHANELFNF